MIPGGTHVGVVFLGDVTDIRPVQLPDSPESGEQELLIGSVGECAHSVVLSVIPIAPVIPAAIDLDPVVGIDGNSTVIAAAFLKDGAAARTDFNRGSEAGYVKLPLSVSTVTVDFTAGCDNKPSARY